MNRTYKVWVEIEELDAKGDPTGKDLGILPDSLGSFGTLKKATAKVAEVVNGHGIDHGNPDRATIEEVLCATRVHLKALRAMRRKGRIDRFLDDVIEGLGISADKLRLLLGSASGRRWAVNRSNGTRRTK